MILLIKIWIAFVLDLLFGDPQHVVHPVQVIGKLIEMLEKILLRKKYKVLAGGILATLTIGITFFVCFIISKNVRSNKFSCLNYKILLFLL